MVTFYQPPTAVCTRMVTMMIEGRTHYKGECNSYIFNGKCDIEIIYGHVVHIGRKERETLFLNCVF